MLNGRVLTRIDLTLGQSTVNTAHCVNLHHTPTRSEERRQLEPELAFWRKFAGAQAAQVLSLCASVTTVHLFFFVIGRVLTRLD